MMSRRGVLLGTFAGLGFATLLGACISSRRVRYRMTVVVETPQGLRTGSAVREVLYEPAGWFPFGESRPSAKVKGEAVAIDLPDDQTLFALLRGADGNIDHAAYIPAVTLRDPDGEQITGPVSLWPEEDRSKSQSRAILPPPLLVHFRDISDPKSVEQVIPANLTTVFGAGYALRQITVKSTNEQATIGIEHRLTWLRAYFDRMLDGNRINISQSLANNLSASNFSTLLR